MKKHAGFRHITARDRDRIHALYGHGHNQADISRVLGVDKSTVSRELNRYHRKTWRYSAVRAQEDAEKKRAYSKRPGMKVAENSALKRYIISQLKRLQSPDEIAGHLKKEGVQPRVGKNAIYKWLYSDDGRPYCRYLCTKRYRTKRQSRLAPRVLIPDRIPLKERPRSTRLVHAEGDLFVSPRSSGSRACGLVVIANDTKLLAGSIVATKHASVIAPAMRRAVNATRADTCTLDNGIENIAHRDFGVPTYFCDKGAPHQKPHIENSIGLIRRWFLPKGTDLSTVTNEIFQAQLHVLNSKYRKSLGYKSAYEVALERGIIDRVPRISLAKAVAFR